MHKNISKALLLVGLLLVMSLSFSCSWLTETGNPGEIVDPVDHINDPEGPSPEPGYQSGLENYFNQEFGVKIAYDDEVWSLSERTASTAKFLSEADLKTSVVFSFSKVEVDSLLSHLQAQYPDRVFVAYDAKHVSGFKCNRSGDVDSEFQLVDYYFMSGNVLISAEAMLLPERSSDVAGLIDGVVFAEE
ncbi:MAG TPA: hypothetical protein PKU96_07295 [bacterium]|nr:hypothetical protein [bacterium]HQC50564.1 hypothetical protein [bacterium]HQG14065.1 hypothetical protein [bacterium]HQH80065.1 hypothetical protein [bacterium]